MADNGLETLKSSILESERALSQLEQIVDAVRTQPRSDVSAGAAADGSTASLLAVQWCFSSTEWQWLVQQIAFQQEMSAERGLAEDVRLLCLGIDLLKAKPAAGLARFVHSSRARA